MKYILLSIILLFSIKHSFAQESKPSEQDKVILKNHSQLEGQLIEVNKNWVVIKVGNIPFTINKKKIAGIYSQGEVLSLLPPPSQRIKNRNKAADTSLAIEGYRLVPIKETAKRGFYNAAYGTFRFRDGGDLWNNDFSFGVSNTFGYQLNQFTGLGLGLGYFNNTGFFGRGNIIPIFAEYRGYLSDNKVSTYFSLATGISFGTKDQFADYSSTKPGSYFYPAIGFKSGSAQSSFMVDIGVRLSKVTYIFENRGFVNQSETILNRGFILRLGILL
jgi:hypothetical protein